MDVVKPKRAKRADTSVELKQLNHLHAFRSDERIQDIVKKIKDKTLTAKEKKIYGEESAFRVNDNKLFWNNLEVVLPSERESKIEEIYKDKKKGLGVGLEQFYQQVSGKFLNISKKLTDSYLRKQSDYKLTRLPRRVNMSIVTRRPNERWGVDLINMTMYPLGSNRLKKYIMTVVDYFTGKVWARAIPNRENGLTLEKQVENDKYRADTKEEEKDVEKEEAELEQIMGKEENKKEEEKEDTEFIPEPESLPKRVRKPSAKLRSGGALKNLDKPKTNKLKIDLRNKKYIKNLNARITKHRKKHPEETRSDEELRKDFFEQDKLNPNKSNTMQSRAYKRAQEELENEGREDEEPKERNNPNPKTDNTLAEAFQSILDEAKTIPRFVQVDNEFNRGGFQELCDKSHPKITVIASLSHQSFTNGKVERMNREIRKKIRAGFVRHNNLKWEEHLKDYIDNINSQKQARTGRSPNELWTEGYKTEDEPNQIQQKQKDYILDKAKKINDRNPVRNLEKGDYVRINLLSISPKLRERRKSNFGWNQTAVHYTPEIYRIREVIKYPKSSTKQTNYILETVPHPRYKGEEKEEEKEEENKEDEEEDEVKLVRKPNGKSIRHFRASDLIAVPPPHHSNKPTLNPTSSQRAMYINAFPSENKYKRLSNL